jgi:hypothetical protein
LKAAAVCGDAASRRRGVRGDRIGAAVVGGAAEGGGGRGVEVGWTGDLGVDRLRLRETKESTAARSTGQDS